MTISNPYSTLFQRLVIILTGPASVVILSDFVSQLQAHFPERIGIGISYYIIVTWCLCLLFLLVYKVQHFFFKAKKTHAIIGNLLFLNLLIAMGYMVSLIF